ncbi:MAG: hypothetical protein ACK5AZ_16990 [Bryobacteraceae bacterium]
MTTTRLFLLLAIVFCFVASAADVTGKWVAQVPGRGGEPRETTFQFKASGETVTGSMSGFQGGEIAISDGKINGDILSFTVTVERGGNTIKQTFTGHVSGDEIHMKREGGRGPARDFTAKRAK